MKCRYCGRRAVWGLLWADGRAIVRVCAIHSTKAIRRVKRNRHPEIVGWRRVP